MWALYWNICICTLEGAAVWLIINREWFTKRTLCDFRAFLFFFYIFLFCFVIEVDWASLFYDQLIQMHVLSFFSIDFIIIDNDFSYMRILPKLTCHLYNSTPPRTVSQVSLANPLLQFSLPPRCTFFYRTTQ